MAQYKFYAKRYKACLIARAFRNPAAFSASAPPLFIAGATAEQQLLIL